MSEPKESLGSSHLQLAPSILRLWAGLRPQFCLNAWTAGTAPAAHPWLHLALLALLIFYPTSPISRGDFISCGASCTPAAGLGFPRAPQEHQHGNASETGKASFPVPSLGRIGRHEPVPKQAAHSSLHRAVGRLGWEFWLRILPHRIIRFPLAVGCVLALPG